MRGVGEPEYHIGGDIICTKGPGGEENKIFSKNKYENICVKNRLIFNTTLSNYHSPLEGGYDPKLDMSDMLDKEEVSKYRMLMRSMNWAVSLGRIDVMFVANRLAKYFCAPCHG